MKWLSRLKNIGTSPEADATETTKRVSVVFVAPISAPMEKFGGDAAAANDSTPDLDRWCWPKSLAMNALEIDTFTARLARFTDRGLDLPGAELLADRLLIRDRDGDDRTVCLECSYLQWGGRCGNWDKAGVAVRSRDAQLASDFIHQLQRCDGFKGY
jgi:hypothetical protein